MFGSTWSRGSVSPSFYPCLHLALHDICLSAFQGNLVPQYADTYRPYANMAAAN